MSRIPEFKQMSAKVKEDLLSRFEPQYCPNCGDRKHVEVKECIASLPSWSVYCPLCGADYQIRMVH